MAGQGILCAGRGQARLGGEPPVSVNTELGGRLRLPYNIGK